MQASRMLACSRRPSFGHAFQQHRSTAAPPRQMQACKQSRPRASAVSSLAASAGWGLPPDSQVLLRNLELKKDIEITQLQKLVLRLQSKLLDQALAVAVRDLLLSRGKLSVSGLIELAEERFYDPEAHSHTSPSRHQVWASILERTPDLALCICSAESAWNSIPAAAASISALYARMSQQEQGAPSPVRIIIAEAYLSANESRVLQCLASNLHADYVVVPAASSTMHAHSRQAARPCEDASEEADRQTAPAQWESALLQAEEQQGGQRKGKQQRSRNVKPHKQAQMQMARQKAAAAP